MGCRSRYIAHRRAFLKFTREAWEQNPTGEAWRAVKRKNLEMLEEIVTPTFKDSRRVKQTATAEPRPFALYNRATWRRLRKQYAHK